MHTKTKPGCKITDGTHAPYRALLRYNAEWQSRGQMPARCDWRVATCYSPCCCHPPCH